MIFIFFLLILNLIILINLKKFSKILNIYDHPDGKLKIHKAKVPLIGGLILILNFFKTLDELSVLVVINI